jgi:hypothetical protein
MRPEGGRRPRPTLRCLVEDLELPLPSARTDLGTISHPAMDETRRVAPTTPDGQRRIVGLTQRMVFRLRHSRWRGATWHYHEHGIVWLLAYETREQGAHDDAYEYFLSLEAAGRLYPTDQDYLRDKLDENVREQAQIEMEAVSHFNSARSSPGVEIEARLLGRMRAVLYVKPNRRPRGDLACLVQARRSRRLDKARAAFAYLRHLRAGRGRVDLGICAGVAHAKARVGLRRTHGRAKEALVDGLRLFGADDCFELFDVSPQDVRGRRKGAVRESLARLG